MPGPARGPQRLRLGHQGSAPVSSQPTGAEQMPRASCASPAVQGKSSLLADRTLIPRKWSTLHPRCSGHLLGHEELLGRAVLLVARSALGTAPGELALAIGRVDRKQRNRRASLQRTDLSCRYRTMRRRRLTYSPLLRLNIEPHTVDNDGGATDREGSKDL